MLLFITLWTIPNSFLGSSLFLLQKKYRHLQGFDGTIACAFCWFVAILRGLVSSKYLRAFKIRYSKTFIQIALKPVTCNGVIFAVRYQYSLLFTPLIKCLSCRIMKTMNLCLLVYTGSRTEGGQAECNHLNHSSILVEPEMEGMALYMEASEEKRRKHI